MWNGNITYNHYDRCILNAFGMGRYINTANIDSFVIHNTKSQVNISLAFYVIQTFQNQLSVRAHGNYQVPR